MSFARNDRRRFEAQKAQRFTLPRGPPVQILRIVLLAVLGAFAAGWAIAYHYSFVRPPMLVPTRVAPSATYDPDAGELPVPEIEPAPPLPR